MTVIESDIVPAELLKLPDAELNTVIYSSAPSRFPEPDWPEIHKQWGHRKVTLQMLYDKHQGCDVRAALQLRIFLSQLLALETRERDSTSWQKC